MVYTLLENDSSVLSEAFKILLLYKWVPLPFDLILHLLLFILRRSRSFKLVFVTIVISVVCLELGFGFGALELAWFLLHYLWSELLVIHFANIRTVGP